MEQWYVNAKELAKPTIRCRSRKRNHPKNWENLFEWMRNIQPWCISRQLCGDIEYRMYGPDKKIFAELDEETALKKLKSIMEKVNLQQEMMF